ncbi:MAG: hypothetical protein RI922_67 [Bacteroidota bacterium]|jgi:ribosomal protein S18 acetylase RimI-like enzyme
MTIRKLTVQDVAALQNISTTTFVDAFGAVNTLEDMALYLSTTFSIECLSAELADERLAYYFAEEDGNPIAYMKLNLGETTEKGIPNPSIELERIYVRASAQGKAVGQALLDFAKQLAKEHHVHYLWLGVWEHNPGAIRFYKRNGFEKFGEHPFILGKDVQNDFLMRLEIGA